MDNTHGINITERFVTAGRALFTVSNPRGERYTFKVSKPRGKDIMFAALLTGPDNESDYTYMGVVAPDLSLRLTGKSRYRDDSLPVRVLRWAVGVIAGKVALPEGYSIHHEGRCGRCGRVLTVPSSIDAGIGPECATKV